MSALIILPRVVKLLNSLDPKEPSKGFSLFLCAEEICTYVHTFPISGNVWSHFTKQLTSVRTVIITSVLGPPKRRRFKHCFKDSEDMGSNPGGTCCIALLFCLSLFALLLCVFEWHKRQKYFSKWINFRSIFYKHSFASSHRPLVRTFGRGIFFVVRGDQTGWPDKANFRHLGHFCQTFKS
jgi:hypothetical protein